MCNIKKGFMKTVSIVLVLALLCTSCVFAEESKKREAVYIGSIGNYSYYTYQSDDVYMTVGSDGLTIDCAYKFLEDDETIYHSVFKADAFSPNSGSFGASNILELCQQIIDSPDTYKVQKTITVNLSPKSYSTDKTAIVNRLVSDGYPSENSSSTPMATRIQNGLYAEIYSSFFYYLTKLGSYAIAAGTTLAFILTLLTSPITGIAGAFTVAMGAGGVYEVVNACTASEYTVVGNDERRVWVEGINTYLSRRVLNFHAVVGDNNSVAYDYNGQSTPYGHYDTDYLFQQGYDEYNNIVW